VSTAKLKFTKSWRGSLADYITALVWSPDGAYLGIASASGEVALHSQASSDVTLLRQADGQSINALGFSADSQFLAAGGQSGTVAVWDAQASESAPIWTQAYDGEWIDRLAWHPSQSYLAVGVGSLVQIWDLPGNTRIAELDFADSSVLHLAWHPDGTRLAVSGHGGIKLWSAEDWNIPFKLIAVPGASLHCDWSADGRYLGSGNLDRTLTVAEVESPPPWLMQGFPGKVRQVDWSSPSTKSESPLIAAACLEAITVWEREAKTGGGWKSRVLQHHRERVNAIAFQPTSFLLAAAGQDGVVSLWDQGKTLSTTLKFPQGGCSALAWHPTGELLAVSGSTGIVMTWHLGQSKKGFG
jgi:WD40 repeat protein